MGKFEWDDGDVENMYSLKECLGEGTYGQVWTAVENATGEICAIKVQSFEDEEDLDYLQLEVEMMRKTQCPYTVEFKGCFKPSLKEEEVWIVMEQCIAGSLADLMNVCETTFDEEQIQQITAATCLGLTVLHDAPIIHRDIKAGNILLNERGNIRITDLGVSAELKSIDERRNTLIGAPYWMAPEIMLEKGYDVRVDVWSMGITIIELADSVPPNAGVQGEDNILKLIPQQTPPTVRNTALFSPDLNSFVAACVKRPYQKRAHAKDLLTHPFIASVAKELEANKGRSKLLADLVAQEKSRILKYRNADEELFPELVGSPKQARPPVLSEESEGITSRYSRMYSDQLMSREEQIRTSVILPTQQGLHGEKVISKEAQSLLTQNDLDFILNNRELRESIKSGVITKPLADLLKARRDREEEDSLFDDEYADNEEDEDEDEEEGEKSGANDEDTRRMESQQLQNKLIYYYSKHEPAKLRDSQAIDRLVEIGMQYGVGVINDGLMNKYGEPLPKELPAQTKKREAQQTAAREKLEKAKTAQKKQETAPKAKTTKKKGSTKPVVEKKPLKKQTSQHLQEIPVPKVNKTAVKHGVGGHESVRVLKDFKNVKGKFESNNRKKIDAKNRNRGIWELDVNKPNSQYKRPTSRFMQPFYARPQSPRQGKPAPQYQGAKYSKWQITPMGFANDQNKKKKKKKDVPAGTKSRPKNFNEVQSWWERRNKVANKPVRKHTAKGDIRKLL